ncbi:hypothetical protein BKA82DRAFT_4050829 [Pisolithus tinctorius]|nr:hypothetical protein BKA82DRAFT_4050829 [Pisolithus tinctorius]
MPFSPALFHLISSVFPPSSRPADVSEKSDDDTECQPSLLMDVFSVREHPSTDGMLEYRILINPSALVDHPASGVRGVRPPIDVLSAFEDGGDKEAEDDEVAADGNDDGLESLETAIQCKAKKRTKRMQSASVSPTMSLRLWLPVVMVGESALLHALDIIPMPSDLFCDRLFII